MAFSRHHASENPLLLVTIRRDDHLQRLCRAVSRIWVTPDFHIQDDVKSTLGHVIVHSLSGHKIRPDIIIIDLENCDVNVGAVFSTIRSVTSLRHTPVLSLVDTASTDVRDMIYDAGTDLVIAWENLDKRIGDIAGLAVDNWLSTEPETETVPQTG